MKCEFFENASEVTPSLLAVTNRCLKAYLSDERDTPMMEKDAAKECLDSVLDTIAVRAKKRKMDAIAARSAAQEAMKQRSGEARVEFRRSVAARPLKTRRVVDSCGRVTLS